MSDAPLDDRGLPAGAHLHPDLEIAPRHARERAQTDAYLLDCRRHDELAIAKIDGAHHVPLDEIEQRVEDIRDLADERDVIVFCHHGVRSMRATAFLRAMGVQNVRSMAGGIDLWSRAVDENVPRY